ncbi:MAG TPA: 7-cyano-7-deazaguanine synthase [Candidatus Anammoximicrobium sp.]|nr:7-cyano-7-deazaguanine synthase [Candidatus Anammoximicrobium sp.]
MDSATCAAIAKGEGFEACGISVRDAQRHAVERDAARRIAGALRRARHAVVDLDPG